MAFKFLKKEGRKPITHDEFLTQFRNYYSEDEHHFKSKREAEKVITSKLIQMFNRVMNNDDYQDKLDTYERFEEDFIRMIKENADVYGPHCEKVKFKELKFLQNEEKKGQKTTYINKAFKKELAKLSNESFAEILAKENESFLLNSKNNKDRRVLNSAKEKLKELKDVRSHRGLFRKISDWWNKRTAREDEIIKQMETKVTNLETALKQVEEAEAKGEQIEIDNDIFRDEIQIFKDDLHNDKVYKYNKVFNIENYNGLFNTQNFRAQGGLSAIIFSHNSQINIDGQVSLNAGKEEYNKHVENLGKAVREFRSHLYSNKLSYKDPSVGKQYDELKQVCEALAIKEGCLDKALKDLDMAESSAENIIKNGSDFPAFVEQVNQAYDAREEYIADHPVEWGKTI